MSYLVLDTETGGITPDKSLLQLYAVHLDSMLKFATGELNLRIRPNEGEEFRVMPEALKVNKIDLRSYGDATPRARAAELVQEFLGRAALPGRLTVVGWNVAFDLGFIYEQLIPKATWEKYCNYKVLDLASVAEFLKLTKKLPAHITSLVKCAQHFNIDASQAHDAKADVEMTIKVLKAFLFLI